MKCKLVINDTDTSNLTAVRLKDESCYLPLSRAK